MIVTVRALRAASGRALRALGAPLWVALAALAVVLIGVWVWRRSTTDCYTDKNGKVWKGKDGYEKCKKDCRKRCSGDSEACIKFNCSQDGQGHDNNSYNNLECGAGAEGGCKWGKCKIQGLKEKYPCQSATETMCCAGSNCLTQEQANAYANAKQTGTPAAGTGAGTPEASNTSTAAQPTGTGGKWWCYKNGKPVHKNLVTDWGFQGDAGWACNAWGKEYGCGWDGEKALCYAMPAKKEQTPGRGPDWMTGGR
jgi:hypothetical protein